MVLSHPALKFVGLFAGLVLLGLASLIVPAVDQGFVQPFTRLLVVICAGTVRLFGGNVHANGVILSFANGPGAVMVSSGCNAVEVSILFAAAVFAFPAPFLARLIGASVGVAMLQLLNLIRIISLLFLARYAQPAFDFFHLYVWDAFIMLDGVLLFLGWHHWRTRYWASAEVRAG